jgi:RNA polymerase sigma factor (sigma-70 family)
MDTSHYAQLVRRARQGDSQAFSGLVEAFEPMAVGYAIGRLRDPGQAQDVAQEAFTDAYLHLDQLRDPAAFPGWFRTIVHKHCDRHTRRRRPAMPADRGLDVFDGGRVAEDLFAPALLDARRESLWLREAIEALPERERIVVALHYLGDCPQRDVAEFLELPLSTVKKRLHVARERLRQWQHEPPTLHAAPDATPSIPADDATRLFLAIRAGDQRAVGHLLSHNPDLAQAHEVWSDEEALAGGLPLAHGQPPLVLAARRGDVSMVEFLLSWGAAVGDRCACAGAETALWVAVRGGDRATVALLLSAGADPDAKNATGLTALHVAAMRGRLDLAELLLAHGADVQLKTAEGMDAAAWAAAHGHDALLERLCAPRREGATGTRARELGTVETGIKALDLWVPLRRGSIIAVHGAAETGLMVLLSEIVRRFADRGGAAVWATWETLPWQDKELDTVAAEAGIESLLRIVKASCTDAAEHQHSVVERALQTTADLARDHDAVALFVFEAPGRRAQIEAALPRLARHAQVVFVVQPWTEVTKGDLAAPPLSPPYTGVLCTDPTLAQRGLYPAIDPVRSRSSAVVSPDPIVDRARAMLTAHRGHAAASSDETLGVRVALLEAFLTEPFVVAEQHTGWPAHAVARADTVAGLERILRGDLDAVPEQALRYLCALPDDVQTRPPASYRSL